MKIYTTFLDTELDEIFKAKPAEGMRKFKGKMLKKIQHKNEMVKKQVKFLSQYK